MQTPLPMVFCLMGPTASGKTPLALELAERFPFEIISVDSAMVYRGMDIGTAKPPADILAKVPHHLIDIANPIEHYSAGQFRQDALQAIDAILAKGKLPLLAGGTMMYFRILQQGLANLPAADAAIRNELQQRADHHGWQMLHQELAKIDPAAAVRIHPSDAQRIQRALEVYLLTGKTITEWQTHHTSPLSRYQLVNFALVPTDRKFLHERIAKRFYQMLEEGFIEEVERLYQQGNLSADLPAMRAVGYRQVWDYLAGNTSKEVMIDKAITATRKLAKSQLTWLRSWPALTNFIIDSTHYLPDVMQFINSSLSTNHYNKK